MKKEKKTDTSVLFVFLSFLLLFATFIKFFLFVLSQKYYCVRLNNTKIEILSVSWVIRDIIFLLLKKLGQKPSTTNHMT